MTTEPAPIRTALTRKADVGSAITAIGAGAVILGSILPWATLTTVFGTLNVNGTSGDGVFTLVLGAALLILAVVQFARRAALAAPVAILAVLTGGLAIFEITNVADVAAEVDNEYATASIGVGLFMILVGAGLALLGSIVGRAPEPVR